MQMVIGVIEKSGLVLVRRAVLVKGIHYRI